MILQIEKLTPDVYTEESRDFQLFGRLFDFVINGSKFDADSIPYLLNTREMNSQFLPLLQTKVGLFEDLNLTDDELRYVLEVFPFLIKQKGSEAAVKSMVNMCLKIFNINATAVIEKVKGVSVVNSVTLDSHSYLIGVDTVLKNLNLMKALSKYIMPTGYTLFVYFYTTQSLSLDVAYAQDIEMIYVSENINSNIRSHCYDYLTTEEYFYGNKVFHNSRMYTCSLYVTDEALTAGTGNVLAKLPVVHSMYYKDRDENIKCDALVKSGDTTLYLYVKDSTGKLYTNEQCTTLYNASTGDTVEYYPVVTGTWDANNWTVVNNQDEPLFVIDKENQLVGAIDTISIASTLNTVSNKYLGIYSSLANLPANASNGNVAIVAGDDTILNDGAYYFTTTWNKINLLGTYSSTSSISSPDPFDVVAIIDDDYRNKLKRYFRYNGTTWDVLNSRGSLQLNEVIDPHENDFINPIVSGNRAAYYYTNGAWQALGTYHKVSGTFPSSAVTNDYVYLDGASYYIYLNSNWVEYSAPLYMLDRELIQ